MKKSSLNSTLPSTLSTVIISLFSRRTPVQLIAGDRKSNKIQGTRISARK